MFVDDRSPIEGRIKNRSPHPPPGLAVSLFRALLVYIASVLQSLAVERAFVEEAPLEGERGLLFFLRLIARSRRCLRSLDLDLPLTLLSLFFFPLQKTSTATRPSPTPAPRPAPSPPPAPPQAPTPAPPLAPRPPRAWM